MIKFRLLKFWWTHRKSNYLFSIFLSERNLRWHECSALRKFRKFVSNLKASFLFLAILFIMFSMPSSLRFPPLKEIVIKAAEVSLTISNSYFSIFKIILYGGHLYFFWKSKLHSMNFLFYFNKEKLNKTYFIYYLYFLCFFF